MNITVETATRLSYKNGTIIKNEKKSPTIVTQVYCHSTLDSH